MLSIVFLFVISTVITVSGDINETITETQDVTEGSFDDLFKESNTFVGCASNECMYGSDCYGYGSIMDMVLL
jgi:hypothetical protein